MAERVARVLLKLIAIRLQCTGARFLPDGINDAKEEHGNSQSWHRSSSRHHSMPKGQRLTFGAVLGNRARCPGPDDSHAAAAKPFDDLITETLVPMMNGIRRLSAVCRTLMVRRG